MIDCEVNFHKKVLMRKELLVVYLFCFLSLLCVLLSSLPFQSKTEHKIFQATHLYYYKGINFLTILENTLI